VCGCCHGGQLVGREFDHDRGLLGIGVEPDGQLGRFVEPPLYRLWCLGEVDRQVRQGIQQRGIGWLGTAGCVGARRADHDKDE
jgi:hypothetical protein